MPPPAEERDDTDPQRVDAFVARWDAASGSERANYQLFLIELTELLGLERPGTAVAEAGGNAYCFERRVDFRHGDGSASVGFIDCYRRGCFVGETKRLKPRPGSGRFDEGMLAARGQAEAYARALPAGEGRPPFLLVADVGRAIELYAEFSRSGGTYTPFPDPRSHRIALGDLRRPEIRARLRAVWREPLALDPTRAAARVTREVAARLAELARSLEGRHAPETVAAFLMRCLFSMFAEDVGLLPQVDGKGVFTALVEACAAAPELFPRLVPDLWKAMDGGGFSAAVRADVLRFNGGLFRDTAALPLEKAQIALLLEAARADWRSVEPSIFGTLLERSLDPDERHALGAEYTPRAYVERLVMPTVIEPLRGEWADAQAAALTQDRQGRHREAVEELRAFHRRLCGLRILDPACGSGNFLYVTLEHLKRLEGEVLGALEALGETQQLLQMQGISVDPHQFLGLETNPRAARIAEAVLWIGYLQWHFRTHGNVSPPEPVLRDFHNIECRDAVLAWERVEYVTDERGIPVTRWDGRTTKPHPVTGQPVPDETARLPVERYVAPRQAGWPEADYIVGNPPFIGNKRMRQALGDGYVEALRAAWDTVPESADFVMFWWQRGAERVRAGQARRFGFIATNSLTQAFNRRVLEAHLDHLHLAFAVPDHPWVDSADGAAVRISMTVGAPGPGEGRLLTVTSETAGGGDGLAVAFAERTGVIHADLTVGANVAAAKPLKANAGLSNRGMIPHGEGFLVTPEQGAALDGGALLRPYRNGRDLTDRPRGVLVIDTFGVSEEELRTRYPATWQWLHDRVKPERDHNARRARRENWWLFGENQPRLRASIAGLARYIATGQTAKHRVFQFLDGRILPDDKLIAIALDDAFALGVLSSQVHVAWAIAAGATLEDRPVYNKTTCFDAFPFPDASVESRARIANLATQIDGLRKRVLAGHEDLTLTGLYNVLEKLQAGEALGNRDRVVHECGFVGVLHSLHEELDAEVLGAYGWGDLAGLDEAGRREALLARLVALNAERAAQEAQGLVRWLRPDYQRPARPGRPAVGGSAEAPDLPGLGEIAPPPAAKGRAVAKPPWPAALAEQVRAVHGQLQAGPATAEALARRFTRARADRMAEILETLATLGRAQRLADGVWTAA